MRLQAHHTPPSGRVYHSNGLSLRLLRRCLRITNFLELRKAEVQLRRIPLKRTSENPQKAKFAEYLFYDVGSIGLSVSYFLHPLDRVPGVEEQPPAGSLVVVEHDAPVAHALQVAADLLRLAVLFPRHELQLHGLVYPVVEFHQASSTLDASPRRWEQ